MTKTTRIEVRWNDIREFQQDMRRMKIRHMPFTRHQGNYLVDIYDTNKILFLQMKYSNK